MYNIGYMYIINSHNLNKTIYFEQIPVLLGYVDYLHVMGNICKLTNGQKIMLIKKTYL